MATLAWFIFTLCLHMLATQGAQGTLIYPYGRSEGDAKAPGCDTCFWQLKLANPMKLFSRHLDRVYMHSDGYITFPDTNRNEMARVNMFNIDLDTRYGELLYRETQNSVVLQLANLDVARKGAVNFNATNAIVISYINVQYWGRSYQTYTFQLVLATDGKLTYGILNYQTMYQSVGSSGYSEKECSSKTFSSSSATLTGSSNVGINGRWVYLLTDLDCFKPITGVFLDTIFWNNLIKGVRTLTITNQLVPGKHIGSVNVTVLEWSSKNVDLRASFIKRINRSKQFYSLFTITSVSSFSDHHFHQLAVYDSTNQSRYFQYGKAKLTHFNDIYCKSISFSIRMAYIPTIKISVEIGETAQDVLQHTYAWLRNISRDGFDVCYQKAYLFSNPQDISVNYVAFATRLEINSTSMSESSDNTTNAISERGSYTFSKTRTEICHYVSLQHVYLDTPKVFVTPVENPTESSSDTPLIAWLGEVSKKFAHICAKSSSDGSKLFRKDINIDFLVSGTVSLCSFFSCPSHLECKLTNQNQAYCTCISECRNQNVSCGTDFKSYQGQCDIDRQHCLANGNGTKSTVTIAYQGKCQRFNYQNGVNQLESIPGVPVAFCKYVTLNPLNFIATSPVMVQLSISWGKSIDNYTHDATAVWSEEVTITSFKACCLVAGRHYNGIPGGKPFVHWLAYQEAFFQHGLLAGSTFNMPTWTTGSLCQEFTSGLLPSFVQLMVSIEHTTKRDYSNAMTVWVERKNKRVCIRELQNYDGKHSGIKVHLLIVRQSKSPFMTEHKKVTFPRKLYENYEIIPTFCKTINYNSRIPSLPNPTVLVTASMDTETSVPNKAFSNHGLTTWIEHADNYRMKICGKTIRTGSYVEEIRLSYVVIPALCEHGWEYLNGVCIKSFSGCDTHLAARQTCSSMNGTLPIIENSGAEYNLEETTSTKAWLGITDQLNEGDWLWDSGSNSTFRKWLHGEPNGGIHENCAIVDMTGNSSGWKDVYCNRTCAETHCQKDANLFQRSCIHFCENGGTCTSNVLTSDTECTCRTGFYGNRCNFQAASFPECQTALIHNEPWRKFTTSSSVTVQPNSTSCDATFLKDGWHRFNTSSGGLLHTSCPDSNNNCGTKNPGWVLGEAPLVEDGVVTRTLRYYGFYCADDHGEAEMRNCGDFYVYKFIRIPYWSCDYGVCTA